ncbi:MAG: DMT family transporter, partial [Pseudomonadota bacterium]
MPRGGSAALLPGVVAAFGFGVSNILGKLALLAGADVLTLVAVRSVLGIGLLWCWLRLGAPVVPHSPQRRWIAFGLGLLFAGNVYGVFAALQLIPVPVAILAYFIYPLLTGISAALTGLERLTWRGVAAALAAFAGLALMIGAQPGELALAGLGFAFGAAVCRTVMLLITRATLAGADARMTTWYSLLSSAAVLVALCLLTQNWQPPHSSIGWAAFLGTAIMTTIGILALFTSAARIGPFRTALMMNLEPVITTLLSFVLLNDSITGLQLVGAGVMIAALCVFQLRR